MVERCTAVESCAVLLGAIKRHKSAIVMILDGVYNDKSALSRYTPGTSENAALIDDFFTQEENQVVQFAKLMHHFVTRDILYLPEDPTTTMGLDTFIASIIRAAPAGAQGQGQQQLDATVRPYFDQIKSQFEEL